MIKKKKKKKKSLGVRHCRAKRGLQDALSRASGGKRAGGGKAQITEPR
jgi:hypothetical protein